MADETKTQKAPKSEQEKKELIKKVKKSKIRVEKTENTKKDNKEKKNTNEQKRVKEPDKSKEKSRAIYYDYSLIFMILFLLVFGVIMIYSASSYTAGIKFKDSAYFVKNQLKYMVVGFFVLIVMAVIPYKIWIKTACIWYGASVALSALVFIIGRQAHGSKRWIAVGPIRFQPSELVKFSIILFITYYLIRFKDDFYSSNRKDMEKRLGILFLLVCVPVSLVAVANLSTAIIIFLIAFSMSYMGTSNRRLFAGGIVAIAGILAGAKPFVRFLYSKGFRNYRIMRLLVWAEPEKFSRDGGYQVVQGLYAIGSGGIFGKGLGQGMQKFFIPEAQNDMIFSIIVEEFGLVGVLMILAIFAFIIRRMLIIAFSVKDLGGRYIVIGVVIHLSLQVILNIAVVTGVMPNTGVSLPFISYGGSSIVVLLAEVGLVLSVAGTIKTE